MKKGNNFMNINCYCKYSLKLLDNQETFKCLECENCFHVKCLKNTCLNNRLCIICLFLKEDPFKQKIDLFRFHAFYLPVKSNNYDVFSLKFRIDNKEWLADKSVKVSIVCYRISYDEKTLEWPKKVNILLNGTNITSNLIKNPEYEINEHLNHENAIQMKYFNLDYDRYLFFIASYKKLSIESIRLKQQYSKQECKDMVLNKFSNTITTQELVSIIDPLSKKLIKCPVISKNCSHLQCFDLETYLKGSFKKTKCPLCYKICYFDDLYEDTFFRNIIGKVVNESVCHENFDIFITSNAKWLILPRKDNFFYQEYPFDKEQAEKIEKLNHSTDESSENTQTQIIENPSVSNKLDDDKFTNCRPTDLVNELDTLLKLKLNSSNKSLETVVKDILTDSKILSILEKLPSVSLGNFIYNIKYLTSSIFSNESISLNNLNLLLNEPAWKICEIFSIKYSQFFKIISNWIHRNDQIELIKLIMFSNRKVNQNERIPHDVYSTIEILIAYAYHSYIPLELTVTLEFWLGNILSIYLALNPFNKEEVAKIIDLFTEIFSFHYFPQKGFNSIEEKKIFFEKPLRFFTGLMTGFTPEKWGKIFQILINPINEEIDNLHHDMLIFIEDFEEFFFYPLLSRVRYSKKQKRKFLENYDIYGNFQVFLEKKRKKNFYGIKYLEVPNDPILNDGHITIISELLDDIKMKSN